MAKQSKKYGKMKHVGGKGENGGFGGHLHSGHYADHGKAPNWDGKKQGPSKTNKGFGPC